MIIFKMPEGPPRASVAPRQRSSAATATLGPAAKDAVVAQSKGNLPGDPATSGALAVVFFAMTLVLCFEGNAVASLRASLGPHPLAGVGLSSAATLPVPPVSPTLTP